VPTGELEDDGALSCEVFRITAISELYDRPGGTEYARPIGPGEPIGPVDACTSIVQTPVWQRVSTSQSRYTVSLYAYDRVYTGYSAPHGKMSNGHYRGSRKLQRSDGVVVTQTSVNLRTVGNASGAPACYSGTDDLAWPAYPPEIYAGSEQIAWNQAEGW